MPYRLTPRERNLIRYTQQEGDSPSSHRAPSLRDTLRSVAGWVAGFVLFTLIALTIVFLGRCI